MSGHFAYFTYLCYTGLVAYMASSLIHTVLFWRRSTHVSFQSMPRTLQLFHWLLFESVVVFAMLVTPVFWAVLYDADTYVGGEHRWLNASVHAANLGCILVDVVAGSMVLSPHWIHPAILAFVVALYLALAYLNKAINGWFTYNFIDYDRHHWMVLVYAIGILAAVVLIYYIIYALQLVLDRLLPPKVSLSSPRPLSSDSDDDAEFKA
ncbi:hypothetical protein IWW56_002075 [Coemansia sp. RSA 2131]|nr:hypothetical protein IWW56_002075 [Coemansia sp. RSA 2131]